MTASLFGLYNNVPIVDTDGYLNVKAMGAVGDGIADDTAAINAALLASKVVYFPTGNYRISSRIFINSYNTLFGYGQARIFQTVADHIFSLVNNATRVKIRGLELDGNKANIAGGGIGIACSSTGGGVTYIEIDDCYIHDCGADGIRFFGSNINYIKVRGCTLENNTTAGLTSDDTIHRGLWTGNIARFNGTHGIGFIGTGIDMVIADNVSCDNGQAVNTADNFTGYATTCSRLTIANNVSEGGLNNGIHFGGSFVTYTGNVATGAAQYGIAHQSSPVEAPNTCQCVTMVGNTATGNGGPAGIAMSYCNSPSVTGNTSTSNTGDGIAIIHCNNGVVSANTCRSNNGCGIDFVTQTASIAVTGNNCMNNVLDGIATTGTFTTCNVTGNVLRSNTRCGLNMSGTDSTCIYADNIIINNVLIDISGTFQVDSIFDSNQTSMTNVVATAATITLPPWLNTIQLTGSVGITNMNLSWLDRLVTLCATAAVTITEGGNLEMNGNCNLTATGTITFRCRGAKWAEVSRSLN